MKKKATRKPVFKHIWIDLYEINIYYVCCDRVRYEVLIEETFDSYIPPGKENHKGTFEAYTLEDSTVSVIWQNNKYSKDLSILVHEVFHLVHYELDKKGLRLTNDSEEAYAYLIEYIFRKIREA